MKLSGPSILSTLAVALALGPGCPRLLCQSAPQEATPQSVYSHDGYGLEKELQPFLNAHTTSDPAVNDTLSILDVPKAESWFGDRFPKDKAQQLASDQNAALAMYAQSLITLMNMWPKGSHFQVSCSKYSKGTTLQPRPDAVLPIVEINVEQYELTFITDSNTTLGTGGHIFSNLGNFIYVDGAYRFLGLGAYPFWSMPRAAARPQPTPASLLSPAVQSAYDDSASGLKRLIQDALKLVKQKDQAKLDALTASMVIPDPAAWFSQVFGPEMGGTYTRQYMQHRAILASQMSHTFQDIVTNQFTSVDATRFTNACVIEADENEYPLLLSRQGKEPISEVRFSHANASQSLRYFAYIDGGFRFLENLPPNPNPHLGPPTAATTPSGNVAETPPTRIKVSGDSLQGRLIKQVPPIYPEEARQQYIQGQVVLRALISPDGAPTDIQIVRGRCSLAKAATDAVRQWRYSPTVVNGAPVEVESDIILNFELGNH